MWPAIFAILLLILIGAIVYNGHCKKIKTLKINEEVATQNIAMRAEWNKLQDACDIQRAERDNLQNECDAKRNELINIKDDITNTSTQLSQLNASLAQTTEEYKKIAEERAQKAQEECIKSLKAEYAAVIEDLQDATRKEIKDYQFMHQEYIKTQSEIEDLQAKQLAYIQTKQREEEMKNMIDYYRLVLSEEEQQDIKFLREVQTRISRKDSIDKIIWEVYYKSAFDTLASHIFSSVAERKCGIYRITCLTNEKAYIGQSVDIRDRWKQHIKSALAHTSTSNRLYQEMKQQGVENFIFEIVEEIPRAQLNEREVYWIDFYKTRDWGLNSTRGGS